MNRRLALSCVFAAWAATGLPVAAQNRTWQRTAAGTYSWNDDLNWDGAFPNTSAATATFGNAIAGPQTVNVNVGIMLNQLTFGTTQSMTVATGSAGSLTFAGPSALIQTSAGSHTISAPITVTTALTLNVAGGTGLTLGGPVTTNATLTFTGNGSAAATGVIGGSGGLVMSGSGGLTLALGTANTYSGATQIGANELVVGSLADGGTASTIGASSAAAGNLVFGTGLFQTSTLRYTGGAASSDRLFSIRNGATAVIASSGTGALTLSNTGRVGQIDGGGAGLVLGGTFAGADNVFAPQLTDFSVNPFSLTKSGVGAWQLTNANYHTGTTTVTGGVLRLGHERALQSSPVNVGLTDSIRFGTLTAASFGRLFNQNGASLSLQNDLGNPVALTVNGGNTSPSFGGAGVLSGAGSLTKSGPGTRLVLDGSAVHTYSGGTTVSAGFLRLDFASLATPTNLLNPAQTLTLNGGTLEINGRNNAATGQTFTGFALGTGASSVDVFPGSGGTTNLVLPNTWTRAPGATVDFSQRSNVSITSSPVASGFIGGWATVGYTNWAKVEGGQIVPFAAGDYQTDTFANGGHVNVTSNGINPAPFTVESVRLPASSILLNLTGVNTVSSGGILYAGSSGASISGGTLRGSPSGELFVTLAAAGANLGINSVVADNGGPTALVTRTDIVQTNPPTFGTITLNGSNTYTGPTHLNGLGRVNAATLTNGGVPGSLGASAAAASNLVLNGGNLVYTGTTAASTDRLFTVGPNGGGIGNGSNQLVEWTNPGPVAFTGTGSRTLAFGGLAFSGPVRFAPVLGDPAGGILSVAVRGNAEFLAANTYTGAFSAEVGTITLNSLPNRGMPSPIGASPLSHGINLNAATLRYTGPTASTDRGLFIFNSSTLEVTDSAATLTLAGGSTNNQLTKAGPGGLALGGTSPFRGVVVNGGLVTLLGNSLLDTGGSNQGVTLNTPDGFRFGPGVTSPRISALGGAGNLGLSTTASEPVSLTLVGGAPTSPVYTGVLSGAGQVALTQTTQVIGGASTYAGGTFIRTAATLVVANTTGSATGTGAVIVQAGGTLVGGNAAGSAGFIVGPLTIETGGRLSPGGIAPETVGTLTIQNDVTFAGGSGSTYVVHLNGNAATNADRLRLTGSGSDLDFQTSPTSRVTLSIGTIDGFTLPAVGGPARQYLIAEADGTVRTNGGAFDPDGFAFSTLNFTQSNYHFSLEATGGQLYLNIVPVPEPTAVLVVAAVGLGSLTFGRRRGRPRGRRIWGGNPSRSPWPVPRS